MKRLSRNDIEKIGERVYAAYKKLPQFSKMKLYKVDPMLLCTELLKLTVDFQHLSLDNSVLGLTSFSGFGVEVFGYDDSDVFYMLDGKTILIESDLHEDARLMGRYNFTLAHEASHQIFSMLYPKEYGANEQNEIHFYKAETEKKRVISDWEEWQANTLAACILLPKELIEQAMFLFSIDKKIKILNKFYDTITYEKFSGMAEFLGCSKTVLAIRMKHLGLLDKEYLDNPYALVNVEVDKYGEQY